MSEWTDTHPRYCKICGVAVGKSKHYCEKCKPKKRGGAHRPKEKVCLYCGKTFWTKRGATKYCMSCGSKTTLNGQSCLLYRGQGCRLVWASCLICHQQYIVRNKRGSHSKECNREVGRRKREAADAKRINPRTFVCRECGEEKTVEYGSKYRLFCSDECCARYNHRVARDRRRALVKKVRCEETVGIKTIGKRDGWRCHLCGGKVDPKLKVPHPMAATRDHLVPLSCGGEHSRANVRLAHFQCNTLRATGGDVQLLLFG